MATIQAKITIEIFGSNTGIPQTDEEVESFEKDKIKIDPMKCVCIVPLETLGEVEVSLDDYTYGYMFIKDPIKRRLVYSINKRKSCTLDQALDAAIFRALESMAKQK